jgi:CRP-like cAMP-binding protein
MEIHPLATFIQQTIPASAEKASEIASHFENKVYEKGEFFLKEGQFSNEYLFLASGFMRAYVRSVEGEEVTTGFYASNQVVFEVYSFFNRRSSSENIQALTTCHTFVIHYDTLNHLFHTQPAFRDFGRAVLVKGFSAYKARMLSMITETAEARYAQLLKTNPEIFQHAPLKYIASYLGITDSSLSRIRKEFAGK